MCLLGSVIALAGPGKLQESIEISLVYAAAKRSLTSMQLPFIFHDKLETDAVVAPADDACVCGNRILDVRFLGICQCHSYLGARKPALVGDHVESGQTDITNALFDWNATGPEMGRQGRE